MIVARDDSGKGLIDAERQSVLNDLSFFDCRVFGWTPPSAFSVHRLAPTIAFDVHFQNGGVMDEAIDGSERHGFTGENLAPFAEGLVGGDQH